MSLEEQESFDEGVASIKARSEWEEADLRFLLKELLWIQSIRKESTSVVLFKIHGMISALKLLFPL
jgi:hypothetical protein